MIRVRLVFALLALLALYCSKARSDDAEETLPARVLCDGARLAAIQLYVPAPGVITLRIPLDVCGRSA